MFMKLKKKEKYVAMISLSKTRKEIRTLVFMDDKDVRIILAIISEKQIIQWINVGKRKMILIIRRQSRRSPTTPFDGVRVPTNS